MVMRHRRLTFWKSPQMAERGWWIVVITIRPCAVEMADGRRQKSVSLKAIS